jgi:hypothetical protein
MPLPELSYKAYFASLDAPNSILEILFAMRRNKPSFILLNSLVLWLLTFALSFKSNFAMLASFILVIAAL